MIAALALTAALQAPAPSPTASAVAAAPPAAAKKHCTYEDVPGSNFQHKVCRTDAEEQQQKADASSRVSAATTITRGH